MREPILKAVAMPVQFLWAPFVPAVANFCVQMPFMFFWISGGNNPILFLFTIIMVHIFLIAYSGTEPHFSNMFKSLGPFMNRPKNMYPSKGHKYAP